MVGWLLEKSHGHPPHSSFHSHAWVARKKALRGFRWAWKSKTKEWAELVLSEGDKVKDLFQAFPLYLQMAIFSLCFLPLCIAVSVTPRSWGWGRQHILFSGGDTIQSTTEHLALCQLHGWLQGSRHMAEWLACTRDQLVHCRTVSECRCCFSQAWGLFLNLSQQLLQLENWEAVGGECRDGTYLIGLLQDQI